MQLATPHFLLGHLPYFNSDPLGFLSECGASGRDVMTLRMAHKTLFLLREPEDVARVLVTEHHQFIKPAWLRTASISRLLGDGIVTSEGEIWRGQHNAYLPAFEVSRMPEYGDIISSLTAETMESWTSGAAIDVQMEMTQLTLKVIGRLLFSSLTPKSDWPEEIACDLNILLVHFSSRYRVYGMAPFPPSLAEMRAAKSLNASICRLICHYRETRPDPSSNTDKGTQPLLPMMPGYSLSDTGVRNTSFLSDQVKTIVAAGSESSSVAVSWALILLAQHPEISCKLFAELDTVLGARAPNLADLFYLPFTRAVVNETVRLFPPLWMTGREAIHACVIGNTKIPAGGQIMTSQWLIHRLPGYFPNPDAFRPERWLNMDPRDIPKGAYFPFGAGPRVCMGKNFALMETSLILASICRKYRPELASQDPIVPWATVTLRPPLGVKLILHAR